jgi:hypothetical protein
MRKNNMKEWIKALLIYCWILGLALELVTWPVISPNISIISGAVIYTIFHTVFPYKQSPIEQDFWLQYDNLPEVPKKCLQLIFFVLWGGLFYIAFFTDTVHCVNEVQLNDPILITSL